MNVIEIQNVTRTFGSFVAVHDLSLTVPEGCIYGFIGPNGSGKTTTLRLIMRIYHPDPGSGRIRVLGVEKASAADDRVGYLPEERGLYRKMRVREALAFFAELKGVRGHRRAVTQWLDRLGLGDWAEKKIETLSKGMAQKVQFITAVIAEPALVILDEPFSGLDPVNATVLREAVLELRRAGTTILFSTHDMAMAEKMSDFVCMIYKGRKVLDGTLDAVQAQYGQDTIRVRIESNGVDLRSLPGVAGVADFGRLKELRMTEEADPQQILEHLMRLGRVTHFELARPSLHDIFVRIAGPDTTDRQGADHA